MRVGETDIMRGKSDKMSRVKHPVAEIGLLIYPDCQLAAIYGLTDLFRIANEWSDRVPEYGDRREIRVSHWRAEAVSGAVDCVWDSHPGRPSKARLH